MEIDYIEYSDKQLVELTLQGDTAAFNPLFIRYESLLHSILLARGANTIEDIIQESFIKAYLNLDKFNPIFSFAQWIITIARNIHIDLTRKTKKIFLQLENISTPCTQPNPEQSIITSQEKNILHQLITSLPKNYSKVIELRYLEELSYEEVSVKLNLPVGTVKTQLHRAKSILANQFNSKALQNN